jgi:hypothetical protein
LLKGVPAVRAQVQADALSVSFEAPLKEFVRLVRSAKAVMADRGAALSALQHAKADMEMRRGKLLKMRGVPGIKARSSRSGPALACSSAVIPWCLCQSQRDCGEVLHQ